ncbi:M56 family metallopeptidase [Nesterenkonia sp.]|uniref:M56 family metallopeptidase n=1 Tax=Nesterenkonia sp. TaxID=704201 RepID=UPI002639AE80|nr:M56 family metallopeptidase [Nesterenkonia sp.]
MAQKTTLLGQPVTLVDVPEKMVFALPRRRCGIAISLALVDELTEEELQAVLAHEAAHLGQRHHLIVGLIEGATRPLLWVPLVRAVADAVPHYLEMAADNYASKQAGTPALASALLKLGETPVMAPRAQHVVLHAAGIDRIRHLVSPPSASRGLAPASLILLIVSGLLIVSATIHLPYLQAVIAGCFR